MGLLLLGLMVVAGLALVAWKLWQKVWQQEAAAKVRLDEQAKQAKAQLDHIFESLNILAVSMLDDQVRIAECCIRMSVLLSQLPLSCDMKHRFLPVFEFHNKTQHIPTHSAWKALDKKQKLSFEQELYQLEREYQERVETVMQWVKENPFGQNMALN